MYDGLRISAVSSADWSRQRGRRRNEDQASKAGGRRQFAPLLDEAAGPVRDSLPDAVTDRFWAAFGIDEDKVDTVGGPAAHAYPAPPHSADARLRIRQKLNQYRRALSLSGQMGGLRAD